MEIVEKYFEKDYPIDGKEFVGNLYDIYEKAFKTALNIGFNRGYVCATANVVRMYGEETLAEELLKCNNVTEDIDESDLEILKPVLKEIERKRALAGN